MSDKENQYPTIPEEPTKESILDFEQAKDMTVGQAVRKAEEIEAGVTDEDSVLDKYIKQHKEEIRAGKFDTVHGNVAAPLSGKETPQPESLSLSKKDLEPTSLDDFIKEVRSGEAESPASEESQDSTENVVLPSAEEVIANHRAVQEAAEPAHTHAGYDEVPVTESASAVSEEVEAPAQPAVPVQPTEAQPVFTSDVEYQWDNEVPLYKRKSVLYTSLGLLAVAIAGSALYWGMFRNSGATSPSSSQASTSVEASSSSSSEASDQQAFDDLYNSFFTDDQRTALRNSAFGNLESLKSALDKLEGTSAYDDAKKRYDDLVAQVSAIQSVNGQFTTAAITDGVVDTNAQIKSDASFSDVSTGNEAIDRVLSQAIAQGRAQAIPAPAPVQAAPVAPATPAPASPAPATPATQASSGEIQNAGVPGFGLSSVGVNLQRNLSRVPYNQAAINDVNNPAWTFNPGVIEKILQTARERGHITGDQYILEKVNIINGNGYYNLFKPDGTYLFSINAKTGYFVGNGRGHADALDY